MRTQPVIRLVVAVGALSLVTTGPSAYAAADEVDVVNTETIQVYVAPDGSIESQRVYEQLTLMGKGSITVENPIEERGLRNLDGFGGLSVDSGVQSVDATVDGVERLRSVSDFTGQLPLDISVQYRLDGRLVDPGDVVGASGELEVRYAVKNVTSKPQEVTFTDGSGGTVTETVDVPIPMVGSLSTVAPPNFTNVQSQQANLAGDGKGGTRLSFTMTLFPPLGSDTAEFGYTATITDGVVPPATVSALPVNPLESPSFKTAGESYQAGSDTGVRLADGATEIDANLLKLRDGAARLLSGLIQLSDGADQLNAGLAGEAAPGAGKLADGANELRDGLNRIDDGAGQLADGAGRLSDGAGQLDDGLGDLSGGAGELGAGVSQLADGQRKLAAGLTRLYRAVDALPQSVRQSLDGNADYQRLLGTLDKVVAGIGTDASMDQSTLMGGLFLIRAGLRHPAGFENNDCASALSGGTPQTCGVADAAEFMASLLPAKQQQLTCAGLILRDLTGGADAPGACFPPGGVRPPLADEANPYNIAVLSSMATQLEDGATAIGGLQRGLQGIYGSVDNRMIPGVNGLRRALYNANCNPAQQDPTAPDFCGVAQALTLVRSGVPILVDAIVAQIRQEIIAALGRPTKGCDPSETLRCAAEALADGGSRLGGGLDQLLAGVALLSDGGSALASGADELSAGAARLARGTGEASDGSTRLAGGAAKLAGGLGDAADGSSRLADGLAEAAEGAPKLVDGAGRLSEEGMSQLIGAGEDTAQDYGKLYATIEAGAKRADTERMAYGAPQGAMGATAYTYELLGDDGEGGRNTKRGVAALAILALAVAALGLRRRFA